MGAIIVFGVLVCTRPHSIVATRFVLELFPLDL